MWKEIILLNLWLHIDKTKWLTFPFHLTCILNPTSKFGISKIYKAINGLWSIDTITNSILLPIDSKLMCIYMEYVPGGSMKDGLKKDGAFSEARTKRYTLQMLSGLLYLHEQRFIHRDLKCKSIGCFYLCPSAIHLYVCYLSVSRRLILVNESLFFFLSVV